MLNKRSENSKTWMNFDGSFTTEIHGGPVHYVDENENFQNINTDLFDEADFDQIDFPVAKDGDSLFYEAREKVKEDKKKNRLDRDRFDFQGLKVPFDCKIPRNIKRGYSVGKGQSKLKFIPVGASTSKGYVEGNKITYQDVWNDADLVLEVLPTGIKETIILKSERAPFDFYFEVQGELSEELKIQPPWLQDANGEKRDVVQGVSEVEDKVVLSLAADVTGLVYPIEIDPTVIIQPNGTVGKDTYSSSQNPASQSGPNEELSAGEGGGLTFSTFMQFDVSAIPSNAKVTTANFQLYCYNIYSSSSFAFDVNRITSTWDESTLTHNAQPTVADSISQVVIGGASSWYVFPLTNAVQNWVDGTWVNYGVSLKCATVSSRKYFRSSDYSTDPLTRPIFTVTYNLPPTAPTVTAPNGGETWNSLHTVMWNAATDVYDFNKGVGNNGYNVGSGNAWRMAQTFTTGLVSEVLKTVQFYIRSMVGGSTTNFPISVYATDGASNPTSPLVTVNISLSGSELNTPLTVNFNYTLSANTTYAIVFGLPTFTTQTVEIAIWENLNQDSNGNMRHYAGSWNNYPNYDVAMTIETTKGLQYQIQLTTNNGSTWADIVALTTAGATSYPFDFINKTETSTAKVRIRAYDGASYGPWDESNGVFTIAHNAAPTAPTNLSPSGPIDRAQIQRLGWKHNDPNSGDPQSKFDLQWRKQGSQTWNPVTVATPNQYWDAPANTFTKGTIEYQIRTYDQAGLSGPYSTLSTFVSGDKPTAPVLMSPVNGAIIPVSNLAVQWSSADQVGYHLKLLNATGAILLWEDNRNSTNKAVTIGYNLANQTNYKLQLAIKSAEGLFSDYVTINISVSYTPPAIPNIETIKGNSYVQINILDKIPTGTQPTVLYHEIYKEIASEYVLIATNVSNQHLDYHVASGETVRYFVRTIGDNNSFSDTITFSESVSFKGVWLHIMDSPQETIRQFKFDGDGRSSKWGLESAVHKFQGRTRPVIETGIMEDYSVDFTLRILDSEERDALNRITMSGQTVCYRDGRGRKVLGVFVDVPLNDERWGGYSTNLSLMKIDYKEGIE